MSNLFFIVLKMSVTASYTVLAVLIVRLLLSRAPKKFSYAIWVVVLFRLLLPSSFESTVSFVHPQALPLAAVALPESTIHNTVRLASAPISETAGSVENNALNSAADIYAAAWLLGMAALIAYSIFSYLRLKKRLSTATLLSGNTYESDRIQTPFVLGLIAPRIYVPLRVGLQERDYILRHEQVHIRRLDYLIKPVAFLALSVHWFNPLIWLSYILMVRDMEMSCDESVMKGSSEDIRVNYSTSLLSLSARQSGLLSPLAFGESNVKARIRNVLNFRKPTFWVSVLSVLVVIFAAVGLTANPPQGVPLTALNGVLGTQVLESTEKIVVEVVDTGESKTFTNEQVVRDIIVYIERIRVGKKEMNKNRSGTRDENYKVYLYYDENAGPFTLNLSKDFSSVWVNNDVKPSFTYPIVNTPQVSKDFTILIQQSGSESPFGGVEGPTGIYGSTPDATYEAYKKAMLKRDYTTIALLSGKEAEPYGQAIWDTIKISEVNLLQKDVRDGKACYFLELTVDDPGTSAFEKGRVPRWMYLVQREGGWYVEGLMTGGEPEDDWWNTSE
jgi:beta-lactamase regulating signal transducer with metallopeptidase domain